MSVGDGCTGEHLEPTVQRLVKLRCRVSGLAGEDDSKNAAHDGSWCWCGSRKSAKPLPSALVDIPWRGGNERAGVLYVDQDWCFMP